MEHRWAHRRQTDAWIRLYLDPAAMLTARARNLSRHGMLVDTGHRLLKQGTVVELADTEQQENGPRPKRVKAMVVHAAGNLAGLMFIGGSEDDVMLCGMLEVCARGNVLAAWDGMLESQAPGRIIGYEYIQ
jgi:hypothetical protein